MSTKVWVVMAKHSPAGYHDLLVFKDKDKALRYAYKWIIDVTGGPSAWRPDEWPQMREAIKNKDAEAMIEYFNASVQSPNREFFLLEEVPVR